ncbi:MAG: sigma-70 family RNA polymerase sigma factor [Deltaproteobacteria bacterium]|nr:sigma-70 family RNA polymerase sigma factor [Deltaproteobacteria bacterium]
MSIFQGNRALLDGFRAGQASALSLVYKAYVRDVATLIRRGFVLDTNIRVPGESDRERQRDVLQDVFVRAFHPSARLAYDGIRPYRPYLLRMAKNVLIDRARKLSREERVGLEGDIGAGEGVGNIDHIINTNTGFCIDSGHPDERMHWDRLRTHVRTYLDSLDEQGRQLVELRFERGMSQLEVLQVMKVSRWTVRALERKVLAGLRRHLARQGISDI